VILPQKLADHGGKPRDRFEQLAVGLIAQVVADLELVARREPVEDVLVPVRLSVAAGSAFFSLLLIDVAVPLADRIGKVGWSKTVRHAVPIRLSRHFDSAFLLSLEDKLELARHRGRHLRQDRLIRGTGAAFRLLDKASLHLAPRGSLVRAMGSRVETPDFWSTYSESRPRNAISSRMSSMKPGSWMRGTSLPRSHQDSLSDIFRASSSVRG
jgi:hypothetical protein